MNKYETMFVLVPDLEEVEIKSVVERFVNVIRDNGGEVTDIDAWGKRRLAYEINDYKEGFYVVMKFTGDGSFNAELERIYRISDPVLRYIVVREEE